MDNLGNNSNSGSNLDKPLPFDDGEKPILQGNPAAASPSVSRAPLNLGGGAKPPAAPAPGPRAASPVPVRRSAAATPVPGGERITGVKTFFTKLHPGALEFMDEQISGWLKDHPEICIKHTNITTGEVQAKKTEPNIIITLWY
jgi:hypothetical protein